MRACILSMLLVAAVLPGSTVRAGVVLTRLGLMGDLAPGLPPGTILAGFDSGPVVNSYGLGASTVSLGGTGVTTANNESIWVGVPGSLALVAREGDSAPGLPAYFGSMHRPVLSATGTVAFGSLLGGAGITAGNDEAAWIGYPGALSLLAREGSAAPGTAADFGSLLVPLRINGSGQVAFRTGLAGAGVHAGNDQGVWTGTAGALQLAARKGDPAPGLPAGVFVGSLADPVLNGAGHLALSGTLTGPGVTPADDAALWFGPAQALQVVARKGDSLPGLPAGTALAGFSLGPVINDAGQIALGGLLSGAGVDSSNDQAIWAGLPGGLTLAVREGDAAPGLAPGVRFAGFGSPGATALLINAGGQLSLRANLDGPGVSGANDTGLWVQESGQWQLVAREGDQVPGLPAGVVFAEPFPGGSPFGDPLLNARGQLAFLASLAGPGVTPANHSALVATRPDGAMELIAQSGDVFDLGGGDLRTIFSLTLYSGTILTSSGGEDGRPMAFNDAGQLTFRMTFTDGASGVFLAAVPEPAAWGLFGLGGAAAGAWCLARRRRSGAAR
jgi:hypothetical protein